jgi:hypothetical protein
MRWHIDALFNVNGSTRISILILLDAAIIAFASCLRENVWNWLSEWLQRYTRDQNSGLFLGAGGFDKGFPNVVALGVVQFKLLGLRVYR